MAFNETVPAGVDPDYYYESEAAIVCGVNAFFIFLILLTIVLRIYARHTAKQKLWYDDWLAIVSVVRIDRANDVIVHANDT
jgi:hypothetical protein